MKTADNVLDLIGKTPMVKLGQITRGLDAKIFVKPEYLNPTGSLKDRIALRMIVQAEKEGMLKPGYTIVESSTGNTGTSLAFVGTMKGYKVVIFETTPGTMGEEKMKIMRNFGAEVKRISPKDIEDLEERSVPGAEIELPGRRLCLDLEKTRSDVWWARQFSNPHNVRAHNETAREILSQIDGRIDAFTASIGTGGTLMGIAEVLRKKFPSIKIIGIQPASSKITMTPGKSYPTSEISGGIVSEMLIRRHLIDEIVKVTDEDAVNMTRRLWKEEGLFAGVSSGANVLVALEQAKELGKKGKIVTVLPDSGDRYLTTERYVT